MHSILEIIDDAPESAGPDLITLDDLKLALGITGVADDAFLEAAITNQSRMIAEYCNRRLGLADAEETFTFNPGENLPTRLALTLSLYPVAEISEVSSTSISTANYEFDPASGRVWLTGQPLWSRSSQYWWQQSAVTVVYSGGYDLPEQAPARLANAVIQAVNEGRLAGNLNPFVREVRLGDRSVSYFTRARAIEGSTSSGFLSASVMDLIKPYRRLHVA